MSDQLDLGFEKIEAEQREVSLDLIDEADAEVSSTSVKSSIAALGMVSSVVLRPYEATPIFSPDDEPELRYEIVDGRRRVEAAREEGLRVIPALVVPTDSKAEAKALTAAMNLNRSPSPLREAEAIGGLVEQGYTIDSLARLGWKKGTIKKRLRLYNAPDEIKEGVRAGDIAAGVAESIANLEPELQKRCVEHYREEGKVRGKDVRALRQRKKEQQVQAMPDQFFEKVEMEEPPAQEAPDEDFEDASTEAATLPTRAARVKAYRELDPLQIVREAAEAAIREGATREELQKALKEGLNATLPF